eukprot:13327010-Alexandrium_andersonii.AAC.1
MKEKLSPPQKKAATELSKPDPSAPGVSTVLSDAPLHPSHGIGGLGYFAGRRCTSRYFDSAGGV